MSFQSTLPRGERPILNLIGGVLAGFQSTLPRGERLFYKRIKETFIWFQSTLPRGERQNYESPHSDPLGFQSTLPRGERRGEIIKINYPGASTQALCSAPTSPLTALAFRSCSRKRESGVCEFVCLCFYI